ncbi:hypothetical protein EVAR_69033_1 [Eumeta japonica]|uniref:Integrase catalytic domain-containing protein n=1 Tax=Eumeta variegata TaxID=151549 RepID=A0A4C2AEF3_EUMVA|nr:hypothetical protein EVAR_69033_1 [Eumeta japonica]
MAALPPERSEITRPFTHTGLDFAGPFDIKSYSGRACRISKGYVCIFVCFSTTAIHLEATSDLSTQAFSAAFNRFVSRRGCPQHLHSANYAHQTILWHFIPAGAPHMGWLWEAGVKSFKLHFRKVAVSNKNTFEEFTTLLSKIEACLNSRPISPISANPIDLCALTPGHFLIGGPILSSVDPKELESDQKHQEFAKIFAAGDVAKTNYTLQKRTTNFRPIHPSYKCAHPVEKDTIRPMEVDPGSFMFRAEKLSTEQYNNKQT